MARRRRTLKHDDALPAQGGARRTDSASERSGPRRTDSPQAGVARLAEVAGNEAVAAMLQRADDEETVDDGGGAGVAHETIVEQEEERPAAPPQQAEAQAEGGGDQFQIGENVDGGGGGDQFRIGANVDGGAGAAVSEARQSEEPERESREDRQEAEQAVQAAGQGGGAAITPGFVSSTFAAELKAGTAARLTNVDASTRDLADRLADAVARAWGTWQITATVAGVTVNGPTAQGGSLVGPPLGPLVAAEAGAVDADAGAALATALGQAHSAFQSTFQLGGLPVFPSFAAVPAPVAPPVPSTPVPLAATNLVAAPFLGAAAGIQLSDPSKQQASRAVADAMFGTVSSFTARGQFSLLGSGPVPTFAPPYVPVGPVVGGIANSLPGGISG